VRRVESIEIGTGSEPTAEPWCIGNVETGGGAARDRDGEAQWSVLLHEKHNIVRDAETWDQIRRSEGGYR
jgi:hypothetical protein